MVQKTHGAYKTFFQYDKSGLPISTSYIKEGREEMALERFSYHNGDLVKIALMSTDPETGIVSESITMDYMYYGDTMISKEYKDDLQGLHYLEEWFYNGSGNIYKSLHYYYHPNDTARMLPSATYYEYDIFPTPISQVHGNNVLGNWNSNNIIRQERNNSQGENINLQEFSYIYDEKDFPLIKIRGKDTIEKYFYETTAR